jgi:hypothetical protein
VAQEYRERLAKIQNSLNDTSNMYSPNRTGMMNLLEETKGKLKESEDKIAELEEQGRRAGY